MLKSSLLNEICLSYKTVPSFRSCAMGTTATAEMLLLLLALVFAAAVRTSEPQQKDEDSVVGRII